MPEEKWFAKGARVAFIGDSITHNGYHVSAVQAYYLTHLKDRGVKTYNCGIGGDNAGHAYARLDDSLASCQPTEAVVMFGVNDMQIGLYAEEHPSEDTVKRRLEVQLQHTENVKNLVTYLQKANLPVTLCSSVGRDEWTDGKKDTIGATNALSDMFARNREALPGLKNYVDYLTPMQTLQKQLAKLGGPSLFRPDRTHPSPLGQNIMARALLASQGLPVAFPSAEAILAGWQTAPFSDANQKIMALGSKLADLAWIYPHQKDRTPGMDLDGRIAYWQKRAKEFEGMEEHKWERSMYLHYAENAKKEPDLRAEYLRLIDELYQ